MICSKGRIDLMLQILFFSLFFRWSSFCYWRRRSADSSPVVALPVVLSVVAVPIVLSVVAVPVVLSVVAVLAMLSVLTMPAVPVDVLSMLAGLHRRIAFRLLRLKSLVYRACEMVIV